MLRNPFKIVEWFEEEMAHYTGSRYAIATNSCTNAIFLSCKHFGIENKEVTIPKRTYLSVPQSISQAGGVVNFEIGSGAAYTNSRHFQFMMLLKD